MAIFNLYKIYVMRFLGEAFEIRFSADNKKI